MKHPNVPIVKSGGITELKVMPPIVEWMNSKDDEQKTLVSMFCVSSSISCQATSQLIKKDGPF